MFLGSSFMFDVISQAESLNSYILLNGDGTVLNFITCSLLFLVGFHSMPDSLFLIFSDFWTCFRGRDLNTWIYLLSI